MGLTEAADKGIQIQGYIKKTFGYCHRPSSPASRNNNNTILITSNNEMKDIIEIVKSLDGSSLLPEGVSKTTQNEAKEQRGGLLVYHWVYCVQVY